MYTPTPRPDPVDAFYTGLRTSPVSRFAVIAAGASALLLVFNSAALVQWTEGLPSSATSSQAVAVAHAWHGAMEGLGAPRVMETLREFAATVREARFSGEVAADGAASD